MLVSVHGDVSLPRLTSRLYDSHLKKKPSFCNSEIVISVSKEKASLMLLLMLLVMLHSKMLFTDFKEA